MLIEIRGGSYLKRYIIRQSCSLPYLDIDYDHRQIVLKDDYYFIDGSHKQKIVDGDYIMKKQSLLYELQLKIIEDFNDDYYYIVNNGYFKFRNVIIDKGVLKIDGLGFLNNKLTNNSKLNDGDCIDIEVCRIIYHHRLIMISKYHVNIEDKLEDLHLKQKVSIPLEKKHVCFLPDVDRPEFPKAPTIPSPIIDNVNHQFLLKLGPSITISLSTLLIAFINLKVNNNRSIKMMIPSIAFPVLMILSVLIWQTLNYFNDKKTYRNKVKKRIDDQKNNLINHEKNLIKYRYDLNNYYRSLSITPLELTHIKCNHKLYFCALDQYRLYMLYLGSLDKSLEYPEPKYFDDDPLSDMIKRQYLKYSKVKNHPLYIDLNKYQYIALTGDDYSTLFKNIYSQLSFKISPKVFKMACFISDEKLYKYHYLLSDGHFIKADKRYIFTKCASIPDDVALVFVFDEYLVSEFKDDKKYIYVGIKDNPKIQAIIKANNGNARIISAKLNELFYYEYLNVDLKDLLLDYHQQIDENNYTLLEGYKYFKDDHREGIKCLIGIDQKDLPIYLNLDERHDGPHGIIAGTTGSGKSELIVSICLMLALNYSPNDLNFVIVDFKGGGLINSFKNKNIILPHLVSSISNVDDNGFDRIIIGLKNECLKRQKLFNELARISGKPINDLSDYHYVNNQRLCNLPHILVIIDEFAEVKKEHPNFIAEIISISRIGRSLGINLLLSTQKVGGVVDEQIKSNSNYRICLKVNNIADSKEIINTTDSFYLHSVGEFVLTSNNRKIRGKSIYGGSGLNREELHKVSIVDSELNDILINKVGYSEVISEAAYVIEYLHQKYFNFNRKDYAVWLDELEVKAYPQISDIKNNAYQLPIGEYDNFYLKKHELAQFKYHDNIMVYNKNHRLKQDLIINLLNSLYLKNDDIEAVYVNSLNDHLAKYRDNLGLLEIIDSDYRLDYLFNFLEFRPLNIKKPLMIIIDSIGRIIEWNENYYQRFKKLLEHSYEYRYKFVVFTGVYNTQISSMLSLFNQKIILGRFSKEDANNFFNVFNLSNNDDKFGYIKLDSVFKLSIFKPNMELTYHKNYQQSYLKHLPENIVYKLVTTKLFLGKDLILLDDVYHDFGIGNLIVVSQYQESLEVFKKLLISSLCPFMKNIQFLEIGQFKAIGLKDSVLFLGSGIFKQYVFNIKTRVDNKTDEAIYYHQHQTVRIKYVETPLSS